MRNKVMKRCILFGMIGVFALVVSGCGQATTSTLEIKTTKTQESQTEEKSGTELSVWCWDPAFNISAMDEAANIYTASHSDVTVKVSEVQASDIISQMATDIKTGNLESLPDIILMKDTNLSVNLDNYDGIFADLTNSGINYDDFASYKTDLGIYQGKHYTVPFDSGVAIMCLREDLIEKAGYKISDFENITWSDFIEKGKAIKEKTGMPILSTQSGSSDFIMMMVQSGGAWLFKDGQPYVEDNEVLREAMETYKTLVDEGIMKEVNNWSAYTDSINHGEVVGTMNGCWIISTIQASADQSGKWRVTNIPKLDESEGATNYSNCGGSSWMIIDSSPNKETAIDFMKSTFGSSVELYSNILPISGAIGTYLPASDSEIYQEPQAFFGDEAVYAQAAGYAAFVPSIESNIYNASAYDKVGIHLIDYIHGADLDEVLGSLQSEIEKLYQ